MQDLLCQNRILASSPSFSTLTQSCNATPSILLGRISLLTKPPSPTLKSWRRKKKDDTSIKDVLLKSCAYQLIGRILDTAVSIVILARQPRRHDGPRLAQLIKHLIITDAFPNFQSLGRTFHPSCTQYTGLE